MAAEGQKKRKEWKNNEIEKKEKKEERRVASMNRYLSTATYTEGGLCVAECFQP